MEFNRLDKYRFQIPQDETMNGPGIIYSSDEMIEKVKDDNAAKQVVNVAKLPGLVGPSMAMPDIHWGYGFPIGGVAAFDSKDGIISPGGVGYDINCGVRLATLDLTEKDITPKLEQLVYALFNRVPCGVGKGGDISLDGKEMTRVLSKGAGWAISRGYGDDGDLDHIENRGFMEEANPDALSKRALERGRNQVGTLGSGNHFVEIGVVEEIFDTETAEVFGLEKGQATLMIHSGSRGLGYQVCDDFLAVMLGKANKSKINLPDKQLVYTKVDSNLGRRYYGAMAAAANFAWANRQILMALAKKVIAQTLKIGPEKLGMKLVYDVCHNIAKLETHHFHGKMQRLMVHRKGATRSFGPGSPDLSPRFKKTGQPVLIPGDMGRASFVLAGTQKAMDETFGSTCHGAGRVLSRKAAIRQSKGRQIDLELAKKGIIVKGRGRTSLNEEMPEAYKNVSKVVEVVHGAGLARKVARLRPLGVIKG